MTKDLKTRLREGDTLIGSVLIFSSTEVAELMSMLGFDYLWIDAEHAPIDFGQAQRMIQAVGGRCPCILRVPEVGEVWIKKALDTGCQGILIPQIRSEEDARQVVAWSLFPPQGRRSVGVSRAYGYGMDVDDTLSAANEKLVIVLQIEHVDAVEAIEDILQVPGFDAVMIGPYDLSASLGVPGDIRHPKVLEAVARVRSHCSHAGVPMGIFTAEGEAAVRAIDEGLRFIALGMDAIYLWSAAKGTLEGVRRQLGS